jgi:hypothetical protein
MIYLDPMLPAADVLLKDLTLYDSGLNTAAAGDSSYNGGRLADSTTVVSGGKAIVFSPKPWSAVQFYAVNGGWNGSRYTGVSFKIAADSSFAVDPAILVGASIASSADPNGVQKVC